MCVSEWTTLSFIPHGMMLLHTANGLASDSLQRLSLNLPAEVEEKIGRWC